MDSKKKAIGISIAAILVISVFAMFSMTVSVTASADEGQGEPHPQKKPIVHHEKTESAVAQISGMGSKQVGTVLKGSVNPGNLGYAQMYLSGTGDNIVITNCPEIVAFDWYDGKPALYRYVYEGGTATFTVTFKNLDTASHTLDFSYVSSSIAGADTSVSPGSVTIPAGGTVTVVFTMDLSDTVTYPAYFYTDWYDLYDAYFDTDYDGSYATTMEFDVCPIPATENTPNIWIWDADLEYQFFEFQNLKIYAETYGYGESELYYLEDTYYYDDFWDEQYVYDIYDEIGDAWDWFTMDDSELVIEPDGDVRMIDHAAFDTLPIEWTRTWYMTTDSWWVRTSDEFRNTGGEDVSFSYSTYIDNYADEGTAIKVPGVYDDWTLTDPIDPFEIPSSQMTKPVIYECDLTGAYSETTPGAFGAIVFPDGIPGYNSGGVDEPASSGTAVYFEDFEYHYFYYRVDLDPGMCEDIDVYYVFTDSVPNAENKLYDAVSQILSKPAPVPQFTPTGLIALFGILATLLVSWVVVKRK